MGKKPASYSRRREQEERDEHHTRNRAYTSCSTGLEKCHLIAAWGVAPGPCLRFFQLGATIEAIPGIAALLPFCNILANGLLERDVIACLTQPACKTWPLADQRLVADFNGS